MVFGKLALSLAHTPARGPAAGPGSPSPAPSRHAGVGRGRAEVAGELAFGVARWPLLRAVLGVGGRGPKHSTAGSCEQRLVRSCWASAPKASGLQARGTGSPERAPGRPLLGASCFGLASGGNVPGGEAPCPTHGLELSSAETGPPRTGSRRAVFWWVMCHTGCGNRSPTRHHAAVTLKSQQRWPPHAADRRPRRQRRQSAGAPPRGRAGARRNRVLNVTHPTRGAAASSRRRICPPPLCLVLATPEAQRPPQESPAWSGPVTREDST